MNLVTVVALLFAALAVAGVSGTDTNTYLKVSTGLDARIAPGNSVDNGRWVTWGGSMNVSGLAVATTLVDTDGDVFFAVVVPSATGGNESYCVVDSAQVPSGPLGKSHLASIVSQRGLVCQINQTTADTFVVQAVAAASSATDCEWAVTECPKTNYLPYTGAAAPAAPAAPAAAPAPHHPAASWFTRLIFPSQVNVTVDSSYTYGADFQQLPWNQQGSRFQASFWDSDGDVMLRVSPAGSSDYCMIDAGRDIVRPELPHINVFRADGLACNIIQVGVDKFVVFVRQTHDSDCKWDGYKCVAGL